MKIVTKLAIAMASCALGLAGGGCSGSAAAGGSAGVGGNTAGAGTGTGSPAAGAGAGAGVGMAGAGAGAAAGVVCIPTPVPLDQFPQQLAATLCDGVAPCCVAASVAYDEATCRSNAMLVASQLLPDNTNHAYAPAGAGCCLSAMKQELAGCQNFDAIVETACRGIVVGTLPVGSACAFHNDCAPPAYCKINPNHVDTGSCSTDGSSNEPPGKEGDPCIGSCQSNDNASCVANGPTVIGNFCYQSDGLYCSFDTQVCTKFGQAGAACSLSSSCLAGEYCNSRGVCAAQTDSGPCVVGGDACSANSYCSAGQCRSPKKPDGEACLATEECAGGVCFGGNGLDMGLCGRETAARPARCAGGLK